MKKVFNLRSGAGLIFTLSLLLALTGNTYANPTSDLPAGSETEAAAMIYLSLPNAGDIVSVNGAPLQWGVATLNYPSSMQFIRAQIKFYTNDSSAIWQSIHNAIAAKGINTWFFITDVSYGGQASSSVYYMNVEFLVEHNYSGAARDITIAGGSGEIRIHQAAQ